MQPKRLVIKNFGPYIHETVDFDQFQETGLFLISGKTGSGKTTLFDSMSYALFGETSGQQRQGREMRSTFASIGEETAVTFLFEHQGFFYEIERKPEQELPKKRGEGMTSQAMQVQLTVFNTQMKELRQYKKKTDVSTEIQNLLNLDAKQFFQLILLPQGEFRNFLVADSKEKEKLLRHLFQTQIYQRFNDWLKDQQKNAQSALNDQVIKQSVLQERFFWLSEEQSEAVTLKERLPQWAEELLKQEAKVTELREAWQAKKGQKATLDEEIQASKLLISQLDEKRKLEETQEQLELAKDHQLNLKQRLEVLDWVYEQKPLVDQLSQWQAECTQTKEKFTQIIQSKESLKTAIDNWQAKRPEVKEKEVKLMTMQARLQEIDYQLPLATIVAETTQAIHKITKEKADLEAQRSEIDREMNELEEKQSVLANEWLSDKAVYDLERRMNLAKSQVDLLTKLEAESTELLQTKARLLETDHHLTVKITEVTEQQAQENQVYLAAKSAFAQSMILRLQRDLLPDVPCPVCGSLDHPAAHDDELASELQNVTLLEQAVQAAEEKVNNYATEIVRLQSESSHLKKEQLLVQESLEKVNRAFADQMNVLISDFALEEPIVDIHQFYDTWVNDYKNAQEMQVIQEQKQKQLQETRENLIHQLEQLKEKHSQVTSSLERLEEKCGNAKEQVGAVTVEDLCEEQAVLVEQVELISSWLANDRTLGEEQRLTLAALTSSETETKEQLVKQEATIGELANKLSEKLAKRADLQAIDEIREYFSELNERVALREEITKYVEQNQFVTKRLAELVNLRENNRPDLTTFDVQAREMEEQIEHIYTEYVQLQESVKQNEQLYQELVAQQVTYADQLTRLSELQQLAQVVNGENEDKLSLERYVLQQFLAEILEVANERFQRLSRGRYRFVIGNKVGSYRGKTGLEIDIFDDHTGETRRAQTLSGGESFIAALALALSLGDVIQARSGGITIDALFIDEGFGSLDEDALDVAIEALEMIEKEGRLIGIISHVRELKDRIGQQLVVNTRGNGTSFLEYR